MRCHSAGYMNADCGDLLLDAVSGVCPNASESGDALSIDAKFSTDSNQHLFQPADKFDRPDLRRESAKVTDGISDELSRAMEGDIATALSVEDCYAAFGESLAGGKNVLCIGVAAEG